jgi:Fe-S cluster biosynthesis and repair protein YggX
MSTLDHLQKLPVEVIQRFLDLRDAQACGLTEPIADYILQVNFASNLHKKYASIIECAKKLRQEYPSLSLPACRQRVYDAINYFNSDCTVTSEAWNNYFADQMMLLRDVNLTAHNFIEARRCMQEARKYRIEASSTVIDPRLKEFKPQLVSPDLEIDRMGIKKSGLLTAYRKALDIIKGRDIPETEKTRLIKEVEQELNIEDAATE